MANGVCEGLRWQTRGHFTDLLQIGELEEVCYGWKIFRRSPIVRIRFPCILWIGKLFKSFTTRRTFQSLLGQGAFFKYPTTKRHFAGLLWLGELLEICYN